MSFGLSAYPVPSAHRCATISAMIRTVYFACHLPTSQADALNRESGRIYTRVMVEHYRVYRKHGLWLSRAQAEKLDDRLHGEEQPYLHAHSIDAAQQAFYTACKTAKSNRANGLDGVKYPHQRKRYRTTIWKNTGIRLKDSRTQAERRAARGQPPCCTSADSTLLLARAAGLAPLEVSLPSHLAGVRADAFVEMRLVFNQAARHYEWHLVIDEARTAPPVEGSHVVAGDLGEIHPITLSDEQEAAVVSCRELRSARQQTNKRLAALGQLQARCAPHSRRWWRLERRKRRFLEHQKRRTRDLEHKVSRAAVAFAQRRHAAIIALGDVRDIADGKRLNKQSQQKISQWSHGTLRAYITYKAQAAGITVVDTVSEADTTQTCPNPKCRHQYKPKGRVDHCPACGLVAHRDVVGAVNILSRFLHDAVGLLRPPPTTKYRHPYQRRGSHRRGKRSPQDTGLVAGNGRQHHTGDSLPSLSQNRSHEPMRAPPSSTSCAASAAAECHLNQIACYR